MFYLNLGSKPVEFFSFVSSFDQHWHLGHPFLQDSKLLILELNHVLSLDSESYQLGESHHMSYPDRVNKNANNIFALVHPNI